MPMSTLDVPPAWERLPVSSWRGIVMLIGAPNTGKSTLARYLYHRLCQAGLRTSFLDGDPGQSTLGPPATISLALGNPEEDRFPPSGPLWRSFIGSVSPRGHMLPLLVGAQRLVDTAFQAGAETLIYDTTGLIDPAQGGQNLKMAKIDLLRPAVVIAIQGDRELEPLLRPLRYSRRTHLVELRPSWSATARDIPARQAHRARQFQRYFAGSQLQSIDWSALAVMPAPRFIKHQIIGLENAAGYLIGLGILLEDYPESKRITLLTPLDGFKEVDMLRLADLLVDPLTFKDQRISSRPSDFDQGRPNWPSSYHSDND